MDGVQVKERENDSASHLVTSFGVFPTDPGPISINSIVASVRCRKCS